MSEILFPGEGALALISDIHGNFVALQRLLQRLDNQGVQQIICLGDAAATGPQPRECLDLL
jgi:predicted phosphodiesterase